MDEEAFLDKAKITLDQQVDELDGKILTRLNEARYRALNSEEKVAETHGRPWFVLGGGGGIVAASLVAVFWLLNPSATLNVPGTKIVESYVVSSDHALSEIRLIEDAISDEDIAILDNIEFVAWLMEQEENNAG